MEWDNTRNLSTIEKPKEESFNVVYMLPDKAGTQFPCVTSRGEADRYQISCSKTGA